jgi:hypothetical protein
MEPLFSLCNRYRVIYESLGSFEGLRDLQELGLDVSIEELLSAERGFTYADLYAMLGNRNTVLWLTPHATVVRAVGNENTSRYRYFCKSLFNVDGQKLFAVARSPTELWEICEVVRRLLVANARQVNEVALRNMGFEGEAFFSAPSFGYLVEQCQSLKALTLEQTSLDENHIRVLGDYSKPGLEIKLKKCRMTGAAVAVLAQVLGRNQGPTKIDLCYIDNSILAAGLRGNSRLKSLRPRDFNGEVGKQELVAIASALKENKGLVNLSLMHAFRMSDETWDTVCDSLKIHPTLQILDLRTTTNSYEGAELVPLDPAVLKSRIQALVDMLKVNTSIHTIHLCDRYNEHELFRESVIPYLETNQFRLRVLAVQKTRPSTYRVKVLGRALLAVQTDLNRFWMLLSGNTEVAFPSTTATTAPTASLPTLAAAATSVHFAPVVATTASNVVAPASGQKCNASP